MGMFSSPWQEASQQVNNIGNSLNNIIVQLAQQRFQQDQARQQMDLRRQESDREFALTKEQLKNQAELNKEHMKLYQAQAGKATADAESTASTDFARRNLGHDMWGMLMAQAEQKQFGRQIAFDPDMIAASLMSNMSQLPDRERTNLPRNMAQIMSMQQNPEMAAILAVGGVKNLFNNVSSGGTAFPGLSGMPINQGGTTLPQGSVRFAPQTGLSLDDPLTQVGAGLPPRELGGVDPSQVLATAANLYGKKYAPGAMIEEDDKVMELMRQLIERNAGNLLGTNSPTAATVGKEVKPTDKVKAAEQLRAKHPEWSKQQIIDEVNKQFK